MVIVSEYSNDNITNNIDKNNIKIMDTLTISNINLIKYIKMTKKDTLIKQVEDAI
jgi:hypothetical protein